MHAQDTRAQFDLFGTPHYTSGNALEVVDDFVWYLRSFVWVNLPASDAEVAMRGESHWQY